MKSLGRNLLMMIRHPQGQCVSCGRLPPWPHIATCPYCNEDVLMPRIWVLLRRIWIAIFTGSLGLVIVLPWMHQMVGVPLQRQAVLSVPSWILLSMATMLFLFPHNSHDVIVCSPRELRAWQFKSLLGSLIIGTGACLGAIQCDCARWEWSVAVACGVLGLCLFTAPYFFRLSAWRIWGGIILIFVGFTC
jgi:hypothetical protein